jgi:hypothetical protein
VLVNHSRAFFIIKNRKQIKETGGGKKIKKMNRFTVKKKKNQSGVGNTLKYFLKYF